MYLRLAALAIVALNVFAATAPETNWSPRSAAAYLDQRAEWWITWQPAQRDQDTFCISCHTTLPYALARPALRTALNEHDLSSAEQQIRQDVLKRVRMWRELAPLYTDEKSGAGKSTESRGSESVINALVLVSFDSRQGAFSDDARRALDSMWDLQLKTGDQKGAFSWMNFHNEPWEGDDSQYWGAALAALAAGTAPAEYRSSPVVRDNLKLLAGYLQEKQAGQSLANRATLLMASAKLPELLSAAQRKSIIADLLAAQQEDGGWSGPSVISATWKRKDGTPSDPRSDGYATALVSFALETGGVARSQPQLKRALDWLARNQDKTAGSWPAASLNKHRAPESDAGRFMSDAATAYAVLALTEK